jgi:DUF4097 and DUF4098 domain-containing protein YvlB
MFDKLIDNYTDRVTKNMGRKQRDDIKKELKSHILDSAEALAAKQDKPVDEETVREVIAKMGPPEEFALTYPAGKKHFMSDRIVLAGIAILVVIFVVVGMLWLANEVGHSLTIEHRQDNSSHVGAGKINIDLNDFNGNINVVESETNTVEVIYDVYASQGHLDDVVTDTTYVMDGDTLKVTSESKQKNTEIFGNIHIGHYVSPGADVVVNVPRDSQYQLDLATSYGDMTVTALNGSTMTLNSDYGDIVINGGRFENIDASTDLGQIKAQYDANTAKFRSNGGSIDLDSSGAADSLTATTDLGSVTAKYNASSATFRSSAGSIDLESYGVGDILTATTDMGHITAQYNAKKATFKSSAGSIDIDSTSPSDSLSATTDMGSIDAKYNAGKATFSSSAGSISLESYGTAGSLSATADMGSIHVMVPDGTLFSADASTSMGRVIHDSIPMVMTSSGSSHFIGYTKDGEGALKMTLKSSSGNIEISY